MRMIIVCLFMLFAIADDLSAQIMRMGQSPSGNIILTMDKNRIRRGNSPSGEIVMTIDGERIRKGNSPSGTIIATTNGGRMSGAAAAAYLLLM